MITMGLHAGERVIIVLGKQQKWQALPDNFEAACRITIQQLIGYKTVEPGFVCLDTNNMIRFDFMDSDDSQPFLPGMMELLNPEAQAAIRRGLFVFSILTIGMDESVRIITPSFPVG